MRAERLTDLMNNLSGKKETKVTVVLYDEKEGLQTKIARRIRLKDNGQYESSYFLNDKITSLSVVHDELSVKHVSPAAHNIVMQGDVTRIISMSPMERRKIIDELAGVAQFDRKIEEARNEIASAIEKLNSQTILLTEFSDRVEALKKERDTALKYQELRTSRNKLEKILKHVRIKELEARVTELQRFIGQKAEEKALLTNSLNDFAEKILSIEARLGEIQREIENTNSTRKKELELEENNLKELLSRFEAGLEYIQKQISDYSAQIERNNKENELSRTKIAELEQKLEQCKSRERDFNTLYLKQQREYDKVQSEILKQSGSIKDSRVFELQEEQGNLQKYISEIGTQKALAEQRFGQLEEEISRYKVELESLLNIIKQGEHQKQGGRSKVLEERMNTISRYLERLKEERRSTETELKELTKELYECDKQLSKLDIKKKVSEENNFGRTLDAVLKSGIPGIHGVLVQLAEVDERFSLALETAAGGRLRSIVVENDSTGAKLIEFLRRNQLGRATFLPLNKFNEIPEFPWLPNSQGIVDWAFNLVKCKELYLPVFAYAFGNTVVMEDLNSARALLGRYRIVTLQGDLLERSGAMTGGSVSAHGGLSFGQNENREMQILHKKIEQLNDAVRSMQSSMGEIQEEIYKNEKELEELRAEWTKIRADEKIEESNYFTANENAKIIKERLYNLSQEREALRAQLHQIGFEFSQVEKRQQKLSDQLVKESSRMKDSGLEDLVNSSQELEFEKKKTEVELHNLGVEKNSLIKEKELIEKTIRDRSEEIKESELKIIELEKKFAENNKNISKERWQLEKIKDELKEIEIRISALNGEKDEASRLLVELTQKKTELVERLKQNGKEIADLKVQQFELEQRLESLKQETEDSIEALYEELPKEYRHATEAELKAELDQIERRMTKMEPVNMKAVEEYQEVFDKLVEVKDRCENITREKQEIEGRMNNYTEHKHRSFFEAYDDVNKHFREIFAELSFGQGELVLESPENPFEGGLVIQARPRNKKMQRLESMSGGEKSLTALSFLFALQWHNPAPFYAFDEVDMFLDGLNVERLSKMLQKQSQLAQFIVVSLRKPMLERSQRAIGVCLGRDGFSKVSGIKLKESESEKVQSPASIEERKGDIITVLS